MMSDRPPRKWRRRALLAAAVLVGLLAVGAVGVRLYLSPGRSADLVRAEVEKAIAAPVQVRSASLGLIGRSTLMGLEIGDYLTIESATADVSVAGALRGARPTQLDLQGVTL